MIRFIIAVLLLLLSSTPLAANQVSQDGIKTSLFTMRFPSSWHLQEDSSPIELHGPHNQLIMISLVMPAPNKKLPVGVQNSKELQKFWRRGIEESLAAAVSQKGLSIVYPLREVSLKGMPYFTALSRNNQEGSFLGAYGLIGKGGVVFIVTVEGGVNDEAGAVAETEKMIKTIQWSTR